MKIHHFFICTFFFLCSIDIQILNANPTYNEITCLQNEFNNTISSAVVLEKEYKKIIKEHSLDVFSNINKISSQDSQCFIFIDRNPAKQIAIIGVYDSKNHNISIIGTDYISTGNSKRAGYWITPVGIFSNTPKIFGWRAEGTKNDKGWMGLGAKGSRIWDFGWQTTARKKNSRAKIRRIRLLIHATDPIYGEKKLGSVASKGCIRISAKMNYFLDHYGILDKEYEKNLENKMVSWLLKKDRKTTLLAGKYIFIEDSSIPQSNHKELVFYDKDKR